MTIDVSLIPQNRVENLISKLSEIENNIGNIGTDITNNVVHKSGNETISGEKNFTNPISITTPANEARFITTFTDVALDTNPTTNVFNGFKSVDSNGVEFANCNCSYNTAGRIGSNFYVTRNDSGTSVSGTMGIYIDKNGTSAYTQAPTPASGDNSTKIATTNWCYDPAKSTNLVHRSGDEVINGKKTFTTCIRKTTSTSWENIISMTGNNFPYIAGYSTDNDTALALCTLHNGNWCNIEIHNNGTGGYATIPTPATNDNSTKIVTTNWSKIVHPTYPNITTSTRVSVPANTDYSIPYDCWVWWGNTSYVGIRYLYVNGIEFGHSYGNSGHWEEFNTLFFPIKAGNVIRHKGDNSTCFLYQNVY